jgi:hypothetical protein
MLCEASARLLRPRAADGAGAGADGGDEGDEEDDEEARALERRRGARTR